MELKKETTWALYQEITRNVFTIVEKKISKQIKNRNVSRPTEKLVTPNLFGVSQCLAIPGHSNLLIHCSSPKTRNFPSCPVKKCPSTCEISHNSDQMRKIPQVNGEYLNFFLEIV